MQIFLNIWAIVGPLLGIALGSWLTTRNQRKHWLLDNKRAEYRKLLTTLTDSGSNLIIAYGPAMAVMSPKEQFKAVETARKSVDVIYSRLFIAKEIQRFNIQKRWQDAMSELRNSHNVAAFGKSMDGIMHDLRTAALRDFS